MKNEIRKKLIEILEANWNAILTMPTPMAFDLMKLLEDGGLEIIESNTNSLLFTNFHIAKDIPAKAENEEGLSEYVLIDRNGFRDADDFEIGYYNFSSNSWHCKHVDKVIDLEHMKWTQLPINKEG